MLTPPRYCHRKRGTFLQYEKFVICSSLGECFVGGIVVFNEQRVEKVDQQEYGDCRNNNLDVLRIDAQFPMVETT